jgi:lipoprotein-anchoring transpeptidase ErfK/SrfK
MPYSMFFSPDGKAIHQSSAGFVLMRSYFKAVDPGEHLVTVGSHGCVGLGEADAKALFERTPPNTTVEVVSR